MVFCEFGWSGGNHFARNEAPVSKAAVFLRFYILGDNPFARSDVPVSKSDIFLRFDILGGNPFECQKLMVFPALVGPAVMLSPCV